MNHFYSKILCLLLTLAANVAASAQVVVTATAATTGPSTYTTLKGAFDAINAGTHKGAITVSITGNTTEAAKDSLVPSSGTASYTSVLIKPAAGVTATISTVTPFASTLIDLAGATNVTIDGSNTVGGTSKDLTIVNSDSLNTTIRFLLGASNNTVKNCVIKGGALSVVNMSFSGATGNNNNTIQNNDITRNALHLPTIGIYNSGNSVSVNTNNKYIGNRIFDFALNGFRDGISSFTPATGFSSNTLFEGNEIFETAPVVGSISGIYTDNVSGITNMVIRRNHIHDLLTTVTPGANILVVSGINLYDAASVTIENNFIALSLPAASHIWGIAQQTAGTGKKIYYNTVRIFGAASDTSISYAYYKTYTSTNDDLRNNMFINERTTTGSRGQYALAIGSTAAYTSNYNNLVSQGNAQNIVVVSTAGGYPTLTAWQTASGKDANSLSILPTFASNIDLHLQNVTANAALDNKGTPLAGFTTDYDNDTRSTTAPDMGADEFTVVASAIASVNTEVNESALWPSVVHNETRLRVVSRQAMSITWNITDASGRTVRTFTQQAHAGENFLSIQLGGLQAGAYNITGVSSRGGKLNLRFVKL